MTNRTKPPYTFHEWIEEHYQGRDPLLDDSDPEILYDGYAYSLEKLGYIVYGNCLDGITVSKS